MVGRVGQDDVAPRAAADGVDLAAHHVDAVVARAAGDDVGAEVAEGRVAQALVRYPGPLLPRSDALYIPTHGAEIRNPQPFVESYIEHRLGREAQIMARLKEGPQTIPQMVARNYADTPIHLHAAAGRSMLAHLIQMVKDGRVKTEDGQARIDSTYRL